LESTAYILAANGRPFSDQDAARIKARTLSEELGEPYQVVPHPSGGFAVSPGVEGKKNGKDQPATSENPNPWNFENPPPTRKPPTRRMEAVARTEPVVATIHLRPAWRSMIRQFTLLLLGMLFALFPTGMLLHVLQINPDYVASIARFGTTPMISMLGLMTAASVGAYILYERYAHYYTVTPELVESRYGIISRKTVRAMYAHIRSVDVDQGIIERLLNVADVKIVTAATDEAVIKFRGMCSPMELREELSRRIRLSNNKEGE